MTYYSLRLKPSLYDLIYKFIMKSSEYRFKKFSFDHCAIKIKNERNICPTFHLNQFYCVTQVVDFKKP